MSQLVGKFLGPYELLAHVGQGGMAAVYRARHAERDGDFALKILSPYIALDPKFKARFVREMELLDALKHPHIVPVYDFGEHDGFTYLAMPYIASGSLQDRLKRAPMDYIEAAGLIGDIASALHFAHQRGVTHRDVKPSNILIDTDGHSYLSDFSFAHIHDSSLSLTGSALIGTPAYMSPEQCRGVGVDARSDQYALGVLVYRLMTGQLPYDADTPMGIVVRQLNDPLPRPRWVNKELPDRIETIICQSLEKEPQQRFESVDAFNDEFQDAMLETFDLKTGRPLPDAVGSDPLTESFSLEDIHPIEPVQPKRSFWQQPRVRIASALLATLILMLSLMFADLLEFQPGSALAGQDATQQAVLVETALAATVGALSTDLARNVEGELDPAELATWVAGTVSAMGVAEAQSSASPWAIEEQAKQQHTPNPSATISPTQVLVYQPSATSSGGGGGGGGSGSGNPSATSSAFITPTSSGDSDVMGDDPFPSMTIPSNLTSYPTPSPVATNTPIPTATESRCKGPTHPQYPCTETPKP